MRNGKIATLPSDIRDELNLRMENGEQGEELLAWLNGLPQVKDRLKGGFDGVPISKQNLSEWRLGGFREWSLHHHLMLQACRLSEYADQMVEAVDAPLLAGKLAAILAARYAALLNSWDGAADPEFENKLRLLRGLNRDIALLQKTLQQASRLEIDYFQHFEDDLEKSREKMKKTTLAPIQAAMERGSMQSLFEMYFDRADAKRMAELAAAVKYNLPLPKKRRSRPSCQTASNKAGSRKQKAEIARKAASGQTESNRVKPSQTTADCAQDEPHAQAESRTPDIESTRRV